MSEQSKKTIKVTLVKSLIGTRKNHKLIIRGLGLKKINSTSELEDTQSVRGMINKVNYLLKCE
jgi:large subunit ribosomal protein L30